MAEYDFIAGTKLAEFVSSNGSFDYIQGPLGSAKTTTMCIRVMRHAQEQVKSPIDGLRYTRFALVRNTVPDLIRTTIRTWLDTFPERQYGRYIAGAVKQQQVRFADVHCDVDFMSLDKEDDVKKLRSTEYTGIVFNELPFIPKIIVDEADSRLRYPPQRHGGPTWRGILADGNAPDEDCWLATMSGQVDPPPGLSFEDMQQYEWPAAWGLFMQPPALIEQFDERGMLTGYEVNPAAENLKNLPARYYEDQIRGKTRAWIDSRLMNRVALVVEGQPVWPMFRREFHVAREPLKPVEGRDVMVGIDFGRVYPAVIMGQQIGDRDFIQHEMLGFNEGATVFAPKVKRFLERNYRNCKIRLVGDPKGRDKGQATDQSSYEIWKDVFGMSVQPAPVKGNDIQTRTEAVGFVLNDNPSGVNRMVISPACRTLIVGMAGRYHLVKEEDGELRPKKDKYSNLCDALQYWVLGVGEGKRMIGLRPAIDVKPARVAPLRRVMRRIRA